MMFDRKTYLANVLIRDRCRNDHFLGVWGTHFKSFVDWANSKPFIRAFPVCKQLVTAGEVPVVGRVQLTGEVKKGMEVMDANLKREQEAGVGLVDRGTTFGIHRNFYLLTAIKRYHQVHHTWPLHIISQFFTPHPPTPTPPLINTLPHPSTHSPGLERASRASIMSTQSSGVWNTNASRRKSLRQTTALTALDLLRSI